MTNCGNHLHESTSFSNDPAANTLTSQQLHGINCSSVQQITPSKQAASDSAKFLSSQGLYKQNKMTLLNYRELQQLH